MLNKHHAFAAAIAGIVAFAPVPAFAYVGPGAGLSAIGTFLALVAACVLAIVGFIWYPIKRLFFARKAVPQARRDKPTGESPSRPRAK